MYKLWLVKDGKSATEDKVQRIIKCLADEYNQRKDKHDIFRNFSNAVQKMIDTLLENIDYDELMRVECIDN